MNFDKSKFNNNPYAKTIEKPWKQKNSAKKNEEESNLILEISRILPR